MLNLQYIKSKFTVSNLWIACLASVLVGLYLSQFWGSVLGDYLPSLIGLFFIMLVLFWKKTFMFVVLILLAFTLGMWRGHEAQARLGVYDELFSKTITVQGTVSDDPAYTKSYSGKTQYEFHISQISLAGKPLPDNLRIRTNRGITLKRGYSVRVKGTLNKTLGRAQAGAISFGEIDITSTKQSRLERIRQQFITGVYSSLPEPAASLGLGYLIGIRSSIPATLTLALTITGLTHIVAVSGYNLTIIVRAIRRVFGKLSRYQNVILSAALIGIFVLCTGNNPSIARATIISLLGLVAWYYGREFRPILLILWGAVITAWISPTYVWGNIGWYLSFLAFIGILMVAPIIRRLIFKDNQLKLFGGIVLETLCAQLMTMPYIIAIFGTVSLIALPANVLVLPLIPLAMLFTLIAGIAGAVAPALAGWFAWPAHYILAFQIWVVESLSKISWAQIKLSLQAPDTILIYTVIIIILLIYRHKHPKPIVTTTVVV